MSCMVCIYRSLSLAEIIYNNLLPLCNREILVYDLRNVPGTFAQLIEVRIISKKAEYVKHADGMAKFTQVRVIEGQFVPPEPTFV